MRRQIPLFEHIEPRFRLLHQPLFPPLAYAGSRTADLDSLVGKHRFHQLPCQLKAKLEALNRRVKVQIILIRLFSERCLQTPQRSMIVLPLQANLLLCHKAVAILSYFQQQSPFGVNRLPQSLIRLALIIDKIERIRQTASLKSVTQRPAHLRLSRKGKINVRSRPRLPPRSRAKKLHPAKPRLLRVEDAINRFPMFRRQTVHASHLDRNIFPIFSAICASTSSKKAKRLR